MAQALPYVWQENVVRAVELHLDANLATELSTYELEVVPGACVRVPEVSSFNRTVTIPYVYLRAQASISQPLLLYALGAPQAQNIDRILDIQDAQMARLEAELRERCLQDDLGNSDPLNPQIVNPLLQMGVSPNDYAQMLKQLDTPENRSLGDFFGSAFLFILMHEAAHTLEFSGHNLEPFSDASHSELVADDFAEIVMKKEGFPAVIYVGVLQLLAAREASLSDNPVLACRVARMLENGIKPEPDFFTSPPFNVPPRVADSFSARLLELDTKLRERYSISSC